MRIIYMLTSLGVGGAERLTLALAMRMKERGHAVQIMTLRSVEDQWSTELPVFSLDMGKTPLHAVASLWRAHRFLRAFRPDLVHSHSFHANVFARALRATSAVPALICTVHNVYEGGWRRMLVYRASDGLSDRTTAVSEAVASCFLESGAISRRRCIVVPNAIELTQFTRSDERRTATRLAMDATESFLWLAVGRIAPAKDYPNLLRAFAQVRAARPSACLWIVGGGSAAHEAALQRLTCDLDISDCVRWLGSRRDLPPLLDAADAFVSASAWEGMPLSIAEAMAMKKPVVVTDVGGVRELVGEVGAVVPAKNAELLAGAMLDIMRRSADERCAIGRTARERIAQRFNMQSRASEWEELYCSALRSRQYALNMQIQK